MISCASPSSATHLKLSMKKLFQTTCTAPAELYTSRLPSTALLQQDTTSVTCHHITGSAQYGNKTNSPTPSPQSSLSTKTDHMGPDLGNAIGYNVNQNVILNVMLPFALPIHGRNIYVNNQIARPEFDLLNAKGFQKHAVGGWVCFRRNYISVQCSYIMNPLSNGGDAFLIEQEKENLYLPKTSTYLLMRSPILLVARFLSLSSSMLEEKEVKYGTIIPIRSGGVRNGGATLEKLQFERSTVKQGTLKERFRISIDFYADVGNEYAWQKVSECLSEPITVLGRVPSYYRSQAVLCRKRTY